MKSDGVLGLGVYTLNDVNLTRARPVGTEHPESWPSTTNAAGHVGNIGQEQPASERLLRSHTNRLAAVGRIHRLIINTHEDATLGVACKSLILGGIGVNIVHEAFCRVRPSEEIEAVKEVGAVVASVKVIVCMNNTRCKQHGAGEGCETTRNAHGDLMSSC